MKVILKKNYNNLGNKNDLVEVSPGYARNFLIPSGIAVVATNGEQSVAKENLKQVEHKFIQAKQDAIDTAKKLNNIVIEIRTKSGSNGKVYGSITPLKLAEALKEQGILVDRKTIIFDKPVKELGLYEASVGLHKEVVHKVKFRVIGN